MTDADSDNDDTTAFVEDPETDPLMPIHSGSRIARGTDDRNSIPARFYDDEHMAEAGDMTILRAGIECQRCGGNVFLHPESIVPRNSVYCFNCSWAPFSLVWWEDTTLKDFVEEEQA